MAIEVTEVVEGRLRRSAEGARRRGREASMVRGRDDVNCRKDRKESSSASSLILTLNRRVKSERAMRRAKRSEARALLSLSAEGASRAESLERRTPRGSQSL
jgi:hypothetical protein